MSRTLLCLFLFLLGLALLNLSSLLSEEVFHRGIGPENLLRGIVLETERLMNQEKARCLPLLSFSSISKLEQTGFSGWTGSASDLDSIYRRALYMMDSERPAEAYALFKYLSSADMKTGDYSARFSILGELNSLKTLVQMGGRADLNRSSRLLKALCEDMAPREPLLVLSIIRVDGDLFLSSGSENLQRCEAICRFFLQLKNSESSFGVALESIASGRESLFSFPGAHDIYLFNHDGLMKFRVQRDEFFTNLEQRATSLGCDLKGRILPLSEFFAAGYRGNEQEGSLGPEMLRGFYPAVSRRGGEFSFLPLSGLYLTLSLSTDFLDKWLRLSRILGGVFFLGTLTVLGMICFLAWKRMKILEAARSHRERFLHILSHELKTPLAAMKLYADMIWSNEDSTPKFYRYARMISARASQSADLITGLICHDRFRALDAGSKESMFLGDFEPFDPAVLLNRLMEDAVWSYRRSYNLQIRGNFRLRSDPMVWRVILSNLADNSFRHLEGTEEVRARLSMDFPTGQSGHSAELPEKAILTYDDNGTLPEELDPSRLMNIFTSLENSGSSPAAGAAGSLGLGLYLVRFLVEAMGGEVLATRGESGNLRIVIKLPMEHVQMESPGDRFEQYFGEFNLHNDGIRL